LVTIKIDWLPDRGADSFGERRSVGGPFNRRLNNGKFVATQPSDSVDVSDTATQPVSNTFE
jgi:hypothetical protein